MDRLSTWLAGYAAYHRDLRNRRTHYLGVPLITYAILTALAVPTVPLFGRHVAVVWLVVIAFALFYVYADWALGCALAIVLALLALAAERTVQLGTGVALTVAAVGFVCGWVLQLIGHHLEGNRPALLDNLLQIFIAPLFLTAELAFALGGRRRLQQELAQLNRSEASTAPHR